MSTKLELNDVNIYYGDFHAVQNVNMQIPSKAVTAFAGICMLTFCTAWKSP